MSSNLANKPAKSRLPLSWQCGLTEVLSCLLCSFLITCFPPLFWLNMEIRNLWGFFIPICEKLKMHFEKREAEGSAKALWPIRAVPYIAPGAQQWYWRHKDHWLFLCPGLSNTSLRVLSASVHGVGASCFQWMWLLFCNLYLLIPCNPILQLLSLPQSLDPWTNILFNLGWFTGELYDCTCQLEVSMCLSQGWRCFNIVIWLGKEKKWVIYSIRKPVCQ